MYYYCCTIIVVVQLMFVFVHLLFDFCSFNYFVRFNGHCSLFIGKYSILIMDCILGISIPLSIITKGVNKHHTSDCTVFVLV
jgi:hypothetical protein